MKTDNESSAENLEKSQKGKNNKESSSENLEKSQKGNKESSAENLEKSQKPESDKNEKAIPANLMKETFFGRIFRKIIDSDIPVKEALNAIVLGYIIGLILTILWYNYVTTDRLNIYRWICFIVIGFVLMFLSYSIEVRCTATLVIPILCSSRGRAVVLAIAFFLAATGPTVNIFYNINAMVFSLTCGQMQLKEALHDMLDTLKKPLVAIKDAIRNAINDLKEVLKKVEVVLLRIKELVMIILAGIKNAFSWLENIVKMCNREFGTPFDRCIKMSQDAMADCRQKLGPIKGLCHLTHIFTVLCYAAKIVDVICVLVDYIDENIIAAVREKLQDFANEIKKLFDVSITFDHDFYFKTTSSKELNQVKKDIMADIHRQMRTFVLIFGWLDLISVLTLILIVFKAIYFRLKYTQNPAFQNCYITSDFLEIDQKRQTMKMETALPLKYLESYKYPQITDCMLTKKEWLGIARSSVFITISSVQLFCICFADFCLFWVLAMISYYGHQHLGLEVPPYISVKVDGGGFVGEIFRGVVRAFEPISQNYTTDSETCLPKPRVPNYTRYYIIGMLVAFAWIFLFLQPYGLRLRHIIMRLYYPEIAKQRAVWLYNRIILKRMSFFKLARRKARLIFSKNEHVDNFSFLEWLRVKTDTYWICRVILGQRSKDKCLLCGIPLNDEIRAKCETVACTAVYCKSCYKESHNICCICHQPLEYGDDSDFSIVEDSSDDSNVVHVDETDEDCLVK